MSGIPKEDIDIDEFDDVLPQFASKASPPPVSDDTKAEEHRPGSDAESEATQLRDRIRRIMEQGNQETDGDDPGPEAHAGPGASKFQTGVDFAANRLKETASKLNPGMGASLEELLKGLEEAGGIGNDEMEALWQHMADEGTGSDDMEETSKAFEEVMGLVLSKEILCEPVQELCQKFPGYLESHRDLAESERTRYEDMHGCARRLLSVFEDVHYEDNEETRARVLELMDKLQEYGSPPDEIMGPLPPGPPGCASS